MKNSEYVHRKIVKKKLHLIKNDTWTGIREGTHRINITSLDDQFPAMNVTI